MPVSNPSGRQAIGIGAARMWTEHWVGLRGHLLRFPWFAVRCRRRTSPMSPTPARQTVTDANCADCGRDHFEARDVFAIEQLDSPNLRDSFRILEWPLLIVSTAGVSEPGSPEARRMMDHAWHVVALKPARSFSCIVIVEGIDMGIAPERRLMCFCVSAADLLAERILTGPLPLAGEGFADDDGASSSPPRCATVLRGIPMVAKKPSINPVSDRARQLGGPLISAAGPVGHDVA